MLNHKRLEQMRLLFVSYFLQRMKRTEKNQFFNGATIQNNEYC